MKKKVLIPLLSIVIIIPLFVRPVFADTDNSVYTWLYGVYTSEYHKNYSAGVINLPIGNGVTIPYLNCKASQTFNYQMNDYRDGVVTFYYTPVSRLTYLDIFVSGATISSYNSSSGQLVLNINGTQDFSVTFATSNTVAGLVDSAINSSYGTGTTSDVNAPATSLHSIDVKLSTTNDSLSQIIGYIDNIETYTDNVETLLTNIRTYSSYLQTMSATTTNIYNDVDTYLPEINNRLNSIISYVDNIENYIDNIEIDLDTLINAINASNNQQKFITNYSYINEYNSQAYNLFYRYNHTINYRDTFMSVTVSNNDTSFNGNKATSFNPGYCLLFACSGNAYNDMVPYVANTSTSYITYNYLGRYYNFNIYEILWTHSQRDWISFKINSGEIIPFYFGYKNNMPSVIYNQFYSGDNPLISSIKAVENAVRNMAVNVNNLTVNATGITYNTNQTQVTNSVTNYNTNINQVFNVENNLSTDFDLYNQQFNPDFTDTLQSISVAPQVMNNIITSLYDLPFIKYPTLITLAGIVLLALLGV